MRRLTAAPRRRTTAPHRKTFRLCGTHDPFASRNRSPHSGTYLFDDDILGSHAMLTGRRSLLENVVAVRSAGFRGFSRPCRFFASRNPMNWFRWGVISCLVKISQRAVMYGPFCSTTRSCTLPDLSLIESRHLAADRVILLPGLLHPAAAVNTTSGTSNWTC